MTDAPTEPKDLSFEGALGELETIVTALERGDVPLEDSIARFERGMALARRCEERLNEAETKVAVLVKEGSKIVEIDLHSGAPIGEHEDPGDEVIPAGAAPKRGADDDDDIPF